MIGLITGVLSKPVYKAAFLVIVFVGGVYSGYSISDMMWESRKLAALEKELIEKQRVQEKISVLEKEVVTANTKRRVIYRDRIKKVPTYIDRSECIVNNDGMRELADALSGSGSSK